MKDTDEEMNRARHVGRGVGPLCPVWVQYPLGTSSCSSVQKLPEPLSFWVFIKTSLHSYFNKMLIDGVGKPRKAYLFTCLGVSVTCLWVSERRAGEVQTIFHFSPVEAVSGIKD